MVNTNNTKFTFNKKGFALSLACAGLLATAGNAEIAGDANVSVSQVDTTNIYNVTTAPTAAGTIVVKGRGDTLGFTSGGALTLVKDITINGDTLTTITSGGTTVTYPLLGNLNLFNADATTSGGLTITGATLNVNVATTNIRLGDASRNQASGGVLTLSGAAIKLGAGQAFTNVTLEQVVMGSGASSIENKGAITNFNLNSSLSTHKGATFKIENATTGSITNFTNNGNIKATDSAAGSFSIINAGQITKFTNTGSMVGKGDSTISAGWNSIYISNTGNIGEFNNKGVIQYAAVSGGNIEVFNNTGKIANTGLQATVTKSFTNSGQLSLDSAASAITIGQAQVQADFFKNTKTGSIENGYFQLVNLKDFNNEGSILNTKISGGVVDVFANSGVITNSQISGHGFGTFTNSGTIASTGATNTTGAILDITAGEFTNSGTISGISGATVHSFNITAGKFTNSGTISSLTKSDGSGALTITASQLFDNSGIITSPESGGLINLKGTTSANNIVLAATNSGTINNMTFKVTDNVKSFDNSGLISNSVISGGNTALIQTFNNAETGIIKDTQLGTADLTIGSFTNAGEITANKDSRLNVAGSFTNTQTGKITIQSGAATEGIFLMGSDNTNPTLTFENAGTIKGMKAPCGGYINVAKVVKSFVNTSTGTIADITLQDSGSTNALIYTFNNAGLIDNATVNLTANEVINTGTIKLNDKSNSAFGLGLDNQTTSVSFTNTGIIDSLGSGGTSVGIKIADGRRNATFNNSGTITTGQGTGNNVGLLTVGENVTLDFNNSGEINLAGTGVGISGNTGGATAGARANIVNTGAISLGTNGAHIDMANLQEVNVKEWHLRNIQTADAFNIGAPGISSVVVKGATLDATTKKVRGLTFDNGSIVIDPVYNTQVSIGQNYLLDRVVVDATGAPVQEVVATSGTNGANNIYAQVKDAHDKGTEDPRLVTINTLRSNNPIFEIVGVDAYNANDKVGEAIPATQKPKLDENGDPVLDDSGNPVMVDVPATTRAGDGIVDSFQINVNASKGAGAAVTQGAVNSAITRNAFIGNVVNNAVNSTLATLNNFNRVSYNDEEVDFDKLEKYAAVATDVTDQTYAKDNNVYVMPYYRNVSVDLATGDSLDGDTYGIVLGGNKNLGNAGVIGLFLGYENSDTGSRDYSTEDDTFFGGINYYKTLGGTSTYDYFVKGMLRLAGGSTDITQRGSTVGADTFSYGIEANVGMNFYNGIHTFTPEVGLSYDRIEVDGFTLNDITYEDAGINLPVAKVGLNWLAQFTETFSTNVGVGVRYNFNDDYNAGLRINDVLNKTGSYISASNNTDLGDFYYYLNLGVNVALTQNWELGVMYTGDFASDASSHSGFVKLGYWW